MSIQESERTRVMKENFMALHSEGESITEIANRYNLSRCTVYQHLQEIADANGVTRESLLKIIRIPTERQYFEEAKRIKVTAEDLGTQFSVANKAIGSLVQLIDTLLEEER